MLKDELLTSYWMHVTSFTMFLVILMFRLDLVSSQKEKKKKKKLLIRKYSTSSFPDEVILINLQENVACISGIYAQTRCVDVKLKLLKVPILLHYCKFWISKSRI